MGLTSKGQYFSFDAIVATVIMVVAVTSLAAYWFGAQSVVESHNNPLYADALRISDSLLSRGSPDNWPTRPMDEVRQIGLANGFSNELNKTRVEGFGALASGDYEAIGRLLRAGGEYYVEIGQTDDASVPAYSIGKPVPREAKEVAVAHRGGVLDGKPVRMQVTLWRK